MTEQAALEEQLSPVEDEPVITDELEAGAETPAESAPATVDPDYIPPEEMTEKFQAKVNKQTARYYAEKRQKDALAEENARLKAQIPQAASTVATGEPKLEDFDYDDTAYQAALVQHHVAVALAEDRQKQAQQAQVSAQETTFNTFQQKVAEFTKQAPDFHEVTGLVPDLQPETLEAVMQHEKAPEIAYYLGKHLDVADQIVQMTPIQAAIKLGEISAQLTATPKTVKTSAAPEPVNPIVGGGSISKAQEDMTIEELEALHY